MKPESETPQPSPRELLEERVIALLLGELSDNDAAEIKALMQADASLQAFHDEMAQTIGVVSDAHQGAAVEESARSGAPAKLDSARRKALLAVIGEAAEESVKEAPPPAEKIARPCFRHSLVKIAAALIALCVPLGGLFLSINSKPKMGAVMSGASASGEALDKGLTSDDFDAEADEAPVDELSMARPSQAPAEAFTFRANPEGAEFSVNLQVQAADPGSEPNVHFSTIDQAEQPLFLPGQSQSAARRMYFGRSDSREKEAAGADPFVGNSRGRVRFEDESRLAELVQAPVSERQSVSPGRVAGIAGRRALEESAPVQVDTLHSEVELVDKRVESRRKGEIAAKDMLPADGLLDAFGAPIGRLLPDTMDRSRMDALFEQAADGSGIAAFRGGQQAERRLGRSRASGITTLSVVPPTGDGFVSGPRGAKQDQNQKAQFGWARAEGQVSTSADRALSPPADSIVIGGGFRAPEAEERKARGLAQLQASGTLAAAKLPALQGRQEMDAKSATTVWFDSGVAETAKAKLELNLEVAGELPPPAAEPAPAAPASPTSASVVAKGMSRVTGASVSKSFPKGGAVVISGVSDQYDFAKAKQDVVAGKPLAIMNGERGQPMQEQIAREAMTESRRRNLAEVERLSRRSESKALVENTSRAALQPMFKQLADQIESLAQLDKRIENSESQLGAKEAQVKQQLVELGEAIGGGIGGGGVLEGSASSAPRMADRARKSVEKLAPTKPNPEIQTKDNAFSTFSLNVSDVSFKLVAASLEQGRLPEPGTVRSEEFVNALNYRDPAPTGGEKLSFAWERAGDPFQHNRDLIRFSIQTAAVGRESGRPLNIVVLLDNSGSMERADRLAIVRRALLTLAEQMTPNDRISIVAFARTPRLWVNGMKGGDPKELVSRVMNLIPQGGTNLEAALDLGYEVARSHFRPDGNNRVILLTDGAANLGDVEPERLKAKTEAQRKEGIALDCFGIGWEGLNDGMLEALTRNADGRYGFLNTEREAREEFAEQLAGALQVAASNVKAQVEFNPRRVLSYRQIGYEKHQLKKEQFRDNTVDAAEIGAAESGTALYSIQVNHQGQGPLGVARIRFLNPGTGVYEELEWPLPYRKDAPSLADAGPSLRLAGTAAAFAEWLARSPYAGGVSPVALQNLLSGVADAYPNDERPKQLEAMIRQARQIAGATGGP